MRYRLKLGDTFVGQKFETSRPHLLVVIAGVPDVCFVWLIFKHQVCVICESVAKVVLRVNPSIENMRYRLKLGDASVAPSFKYQICVIGAWPEI